MGHTGSGRGLYAYASQRGFVAIWRDRTAARGFGCRGARSWLWCRPKRRAARQTRLACPWHRFINGDAADRPPVGARAWGSREGPSDGRPDGSTPSARSIVRSARCARHLESGAIGRGISTSGSRSRARRETRSRIVRVHVLEVHTARRGNAGLRRDVRVHSVLRTTAMLPHRRAVAV